VQLIGHRRVDKNPIFAISFAAACGKDESRRLSSAAAPRHISLDPRPLIASNNRSIFGRSSRYVTVMAPPRRVLVVDDDEGVRLMFARALMMDGYGVAVAATAEEALHKIEQGRPDAILLDLKMPIINGVGFLYRLRESPANHDIRVAVITGAPSLDDATVNDLRVLNAQVWHKPLSIKDIQQVARTLLTRSRSDGAEYSTAP
jgi:CheY-like chemotaxis protein